MASRSSHGRAASRYVGMCVTLLHCSAPLIRSRPWRYINLLTYLLTFTLAESYLSRAVHEAGAAAEMAASRKEEKYVDLGAR